MLDLIVGKVGPVFLTILGGFLLTHVKIISREGIPFLAKIAMNVFIPAMLFQTLSQSDISAHFDLRLWGSYYSGVLLNFALVFMAARVWLKAKTDEAAVTAMGGVFSNIVLLGIPLVQAVYGEEGLVPLLIVLSIHPLTLLGLTILIVEGTRGGDGHWLPKVVRSVVRVMRNPIIIAIVMGVLASLIDLPIPEMINGTLERFRTAGPTIALLLVGAGLYGQSVRGNLSASLLCTVAKMFVQPVLVFSVAHFVFDLPPLWLTIVTLVAALPAGANVAVVAGNYNVCVDRSSTTILITTIISMLTLPLLVLYAGPQ
ncbi:MULTISPECIES: AEC family transporter [Thalassospira]|uniref:Transporter n=1 Tax=Thalassospira lohafexi TaxID=744227 RepID=A0A2N3L6W1_9PROT|nr:MULTISPECIES: AEC family transporter [Thalassospira]PKR58551.1 transporter [Thalassospira lohafexi]|tara:strand:- start:663 stop:1604 length:942 start_codon:yes stop_codon:yes gene_type:complete